MRALTTAIISLVLIFGLAAQDAFAHISRKEACNRVEMGGWSVAYGAKTTKYDARRGYVEPGLSIFHADRRYLREWSSRILDRSIYKMEMRHGACMDFLKNDKRLQRDVQRFFVNSVRKFLRTNHGGASVMKIGRLEVKAGVVKYFSRRTQSTVVMPYLGLRMKERRGWSHRERLWR